MNPTYIQAVASGEKKLYRSMIATPQWEASAPSPRTEIAARVLDPLGPVDLQPRQTLAGGIGRKFAFGGSELFVVNHEPEGAERIGLRWPALGQRPTSRSRGK